MTLPFRIQVLLGQLHAGYEWEKEDGTVWRLTDLWIEENGKGYTTKTIWRRMYAVFSEEIVVICKFMRENK